MLCEGVWACVGEVCVQEKGTSSRVRGEMLQSASMEINNAIVKINSWH